MRGKMHAAAKTTTSAGSYQQSANTYTNRKPYALVQSNWPDFTPKW